MPVKDFIVAIELGSSKLRGIAGRKNLDGSITVSAIAARRHPETLEEYKKK